MINSTIIISEHHKLKQEKISKKIKIKIPIFKFYSHKVVSKIICLSSFTKQANFRLKLNLFINQRTLTSNFTNLSLVHKNNLICLLYCQEHLQTWKLKPILCNFQVCLPLVLIGDWKSSDVVIKCSLSAKVPTKSNPKQAWTKS